jgi:hypothetical protein
MFNMERAASEWNMSVNAKPQATGLRKLRPITAGMPCFLLGETP